MKTTTLIWTVAAVIAALAILYFAFLSPSPDDADLHGAIGAARVHRADQISDTDVVIQDPEIQDLLQSEFFYKLCTDNEFRKMAIDQLARLELASGRSLQFASAASLADMRAFLDLVLSKNDLKMALAEGRMNVVAEILAKDNKLALLDVANRIYLVQGRTSKLNLAMFSEMKSFLDQALVNADLRQALVQGRMNLVQQILADRRQPGLTVAAQKVLIAESRQSQFQLASLADKKVFLDFAMTNADLRAALTAGRMDRIGEILISENRRELLAVANQIHHVLGRSTQLDAATLEDMRMFLDLAVVNRDLKLALAENRLEQINEILVKDGRANLLDAAHKVFLADRRQIQFVEAGLADLKLVLDLAANNADLKLALAEGRMNQVGEILARDNRLALLDAANRVYLTQGRHHQLNAATLADMKGFLDIALANPGMRQALTEGRIARIEESLINDGRTALILAANRVHLAEHRRPMIFSEAALGDMRSILSFAHDNADFRSALHENRLDMAAEMALRAGRYEISLRNLKMASFVLGDHRSFIAELNRVLTLVESPAYRLAVANPGWGRLVMSADPALWKHTIEAVMDGKLVMQQQ